MFLFRLIQIASNDTPKESTYEKVYDDFFENVVKNDNSTRAIDMIKSLKPLFTLYTNDPGLTVTHLDVKQDWWLGMRNVLKHLESPELETDLNEIEEKQLKINSLCDSIIQKLKISTISNPFHINTEHHEHKVLRSFSYMKKIYSELKEKVALEFEETPDTKMFFHLNYNRARTAFQSVKSVTQRYAIIGETGNKTPVITAANKQLEIFKDQIKKLKESEAKLRTRLEKIEKILEQYLKERRIWAESLIEYTKILRSQNLPLLLDNEVRFVLPVKETKTTFHEEKQTQFSYTNKQNPTKLVETKNDMKSKGTKIGGNTAEDEETPGCFCFNNWFKSLF